MKQIRITLLSKPFTEEEAMKFYEVLQYTKPPFTDFTAKVELEEVTSSDAGGTQPASDSVH